MEKLCECGCGLLAKPGKRFAQYHQVGLNGRALVWDKERKKYEYRYRVAMESKIGRKLNPGECVHHKNGNILDDSIDNLVLCESHAEHLTNHHNHTYATFSCVICGKEHRGEIRRKYHFCSRECWKKWKSPGRPITSGLGVTSEIICEQCGKSVVRKGKRSHTFCSHECYSAWLKGQTGTVRSNSQILEYEGRSLIMAEWAIEKKIPYKTLYNRIVKLGWTVEEALTVPVRPLRC